jgi:hypothetical protein
MMSLSTNWRSWHASIALSSPTHLRIQSDSRLVGTLPHSKSNKWISRWIHCNTIVYQLERALVITAHGRFMSGHELELLFKYCRLLRASVEYRIKHVIRLTSQCHVKKCSNTNRVLVAIPSCRSLRWHRYPERTTPSSPHLGRLGQGHNLNTHTWDSFLKFYPVNFRFHLCEPCMPARM